jgi:hypothetical protein
MGKNLADVEYKMRMTQDLKDKIVESAKEHNRSMNADIVARLEKSFESEINATETFEFEAMKRIHKKQADELKALGEYLQDARETRMLLIEFMNRNFDDLPINLQSNFAKLVLEAAKSGESAPFDKKLELMLKNILQDTIDRLEKYSEFGTW